MTHQEDIERRIKKITEILILARTSLLDIEYMWNSLKEGQHKTYEKLFSRLIEGQWYYTLIETNKLFETDGAYSLEKLKNILTTNHRQLDWKNKPTIEQINQCYSEFYGDDRIPLIITNLKNIRDKHLAHSELKQQAFTTKSEEIKFLHEKTFKIVNFVCTNLFDYSQGFELGKNDLQHFLFDKLN